MHVIIWSKFNTWFCQTFSVVDQKNTLTPFEALRCVIHVITFVELVGSRDC